MKAGRPRYHVPAKWLSVYSPNCGLLYYELDSKGNLAKNFNDNLLPRPFNLFSVQDNTNIKKQKKTKKDKEDDKEEKEFTFNKNTTPKEKKPKDDDLLHIFENEISNIDVYHEEDNSFEITNFFE